MPSNPVDFHALRKLYTLSPEVTYLNHGSFGAVPIPVQRVFQDLQRQMEENPSHFMSHVLRERYLQTRQALAEFVSTQAANLAFVTNATMGINVFARSLPLARGDEVLATNQEYGATQKAMQYRCRQAQARYVIQPVPFPVDSPTEWVDRFWEGVTRRTKVIFFSHITSPTALTLPIREICRRARAEGILTVVDGAHAPGQVDLHLDDWGVDFYTGNCHKWLSSPRGNGFIFVAPRHHERVEPLVVSHGWNPEERSPDPLYDYFAWQGTGDPCGLLSVPSALDYLHDLPWPRVRAQVHAMAAAARAQISDLFDLPPTATDGHDWWSLMFTARLPAGGAERLGPRLWTEHRIVAPVIRFADYDLIRVSVKEYNTPADLNRLLEVLASELL